MGVERLADGRWRVDVVGPDGRRVRRLVRTVAEAQGLLGVGQGVTFAQHVEEWLAAGADTWKGGRGGGTWHGYESAVRVQLVPLLGAKPVGQITREDIEAVRAELLAHLAPKTVANILSCLRSCLTRAVEQGRALINPASKVRAPPALEPVFAWWTREEAGAVLRALAKPPQGRPWAPWAPLFFRLALRTGLRLGELVALEWRDVDLRVGVIHVRRARSHGKLGMPKSGKARTVPIYSDLKLLLAVEQGSEGLVFEQRGGWLTPSAVRRQLGRVIVAARVPEIRIHDLRHTYASHLVLAGVPLPHLQVLMGHAHFKTTLRYAHLAPDAVHDLARQTADRFWSAVD